MERLTARLLLAVLALVPAARREWGEAVLAEADQVPAGRARLSWLVGGLWLAIWEVDVARRLGYPVGGMLAGAMLIWLDWHPHSANPAGPINQLTLVVVVLILAAVPLIARPIVGPVADSRAARTVRAGGYLAVYAVLAAMVGLWRFADTWFDQMSAFDQQSRHADVRTQAVLTAVVVIILMAAYGIGIVLVTARRAVDDALSSAEEPAYSAASATLTLGAGLGAGSAVVTYIVMPLGTPRLLIVVLVALLTAPVLAGVLAGRRATPAHRLRAGSVAGLCAGATAALLLNVLTVATMLLFPHQVSLEWANPDPAVVHGTPFEVQMSIGDAAITYQAGLLVLPLLGLVLGAIGGLGLSGEVAEVSPIRQTLGQTLGQAVAQPGEGRS
jgi:hypothetical protein